MRPILPPVLCHARAERRVPLRCHPRNLHARPPGRRTRGLACRAAGAERPRAEGCANLQAAQAPGAALALRGQEGHFQGACQVVTRERDWVRV